MAVQRVTADVIDQLLGPHAVPGLSDIHLVIEFVAFAVLLRRVLQYSICVYNVNRFPNKK